MSNYLKIDTAENTYVTVEDADFPLLSSSPAKPASFAIWCRFLSRSVSMSLLHQYTTKGFKATFNEEINGDLSLEWFVENSSGTTTTSRIENVPIKLNEWQLFVFIVGKGGFGNQSIYIDAVEHADSITEGASPGGGYEDATDFYIGYNPNEPSASTLGAIDIDGFGIYPDVYLTESEVRDIYNKGRGVKMTDSTTDLDFGFNFDEGTGSELTDVITNSIVGTISSNVSPFDNIWGETGGVGVLEPSDLKLYLTSLEPDIAQTNYSQSLGGHIAYSTINPSATSLIYPETTIATNAVGTYQSNLILDDYTDLEGYEYIAMRSEVAKVNAISSNAVTATERGVNGIVGYYPVETVVQGVTDLFNDTFNSDKKQYRCYALRNTSLTETASAVSVYFRELSQNIGTTMALAIEYPKSQGITGITSSWTSSMLVDSSIAGTYEDNLFADSYITFEDSPNAGQKVRINSYDGTTGTFVLADSLAVDFNEEDDSSLINYTVDASPAQRIRTGTDTPTENSYISDFSEATSRENAVSLESVDEVGDMSVGDIIYVWIEREVSKASDIYEDNSFVLSIDFEKELEGN